MEPKDRRTDIMNPISQFRYSILNTIFIYIGPEKFLAFWQTVQPISCYRLSRYIIYTRGILANKNALISESSSSKCHNENR
jgi:hypothetical protein